MRTVVVAGMSAALAERVRPLLEALELEPFEVRLNLTGDDASALPLAGALASAKGDSASTVVLVSSAIVYGAWPDNPVPLAEEATLRPNPGFSPAVLLAEAERLVAEWGTSHPGAAVAVLRPAVIVGAGWSRIDRAVTGLGGPRTGDLGRPVQFVHVDDVASAVVLAANLRLRGVFNVAPDGWIAEETAGELVGGVARLSLSRRVLRVRALPYAIHPWVVANDRLRATGWAPRHSSEEALVDGVVAPRWSSLPPNRRQQLALLASVAGVIGVATSAVGGVSALLRRRRSHR